MKRDFRRSLGVSIIVIGLFALMAMPVAARGFWGRGGNTPPVYSQPTPVSTSTPTQSPSSFNFNCNVAFPSQYGTANISGIVGGVSVNFGSQNTSYSATFSGTAGTIYTNNVHYTFEYEHISCTDNKLIVQGADSLQRSFSLTAENRNGQMTVTLHSALYNVSGTFVGTMSIVPVHN